MMKLCLYFFMLIPLFSMNLWVLICLFLMFGFFLFFNSFWFLGYFSMLSYSLGGDMLSMCMVFLSIWIVLLMVLSSFNIKFNGNYSVFFLFMNFFLLFFLIISFSSLNLFIFYLFFESSLIPTLFLIYGWGYQPERLGAGFYLLFYTLFASLPLLMVIFYVSSNSLTLNYYLIDVVCNFYVYLFIILAFLIKMPMFFFHFWLPSAHVEAPVAGSMILAGVLLKLGGYGLMRIFNFVYIYSVLYNYFFVCLSLCGGVIIGFVCMYQTDIKTLIACSSVAHMGLVLCGIFTFNDWGLKGSLILMLGHGLCSSGLFCLANILYESVGSRSLIINKGMMIFFPSLSMFWFILSVNNMSSPISLNFVGELMLINSIMSWSGFSFIFLGLMSFMSCCYSIYLYSYIQHGVSFGGLKFFQMVNLREYLLIFFHLLPLNIIFLKVDIFILWF